MMKSTINKWLFRLCLVAGIMMGGSMLPSSDVYAQSKKTTTTKKSTTTTKKTTTTAKKAVTTADKKAQLKNEQAATQKKRQQSQQQIAIINRNIKANLDSVIVLDNRIGRQKSVIDSLDREIKALNIKIDTLNAQITRLKKELVDKKQKYSHAMVYMQKHKTVQEKMMFIFSAENLSQIIRRMRYIKEYSSYLKAQGEMIKAQQKEMEAKQEEMVAAKAKVEANLAEMKRKEVALEGMKSSCQSKVAYLNKNLGVVQNQIKQYQAKEASLNAQIDKLIQQEIEEARRKAEEEARRKAEEARKAEAIRKEKERQLEEAKAAKERAEAAVKAAATDEEKKAAKAELSNANAAIKAAEKDVKAAVKAEKEEAKSEVAAFKKGSDDVKLSSNFAANKGRLPMPITGSYTVVGHYGTYNVAGLKNVTLDNKGIDIRGTSGAMARSVFDGEVSSIFQYGATYIVMVRHGSYISVYSGLSSVSVSKGMKVSTRQSIGKVGTDADGHITLHFQLRKESARLNPEQWVK